MAEESQSPEPGVGKLVRMANDEPTSPQALMRRATDVASVCREIVLKTASEIQGKKFVRVEGWESIATAHGCFVGAQEAERVYDKDGTLIGYKATGVLRNSHGQIIATGEGFVGFDEKDRKGNPTWKNRPEYAGKAMAQTRAISRACRGVFAHVVVLMDAKLSTTPAEEVPDGGFDDTKPAKPAPAKPAVKATPKTRAWFLDKLRESFDEPTLLTYAIARDYLEGEGLESWALDKVLLKRTEIAKLQADILEFVKSGKTKAKPKANGKTLPTSPQGQLATLCTAAGFSFDEFSDWAVATGNLEPDKFTTFEDFPEDRAEFFVRSFKSILKALQAARGQNEPPTP